MKNDWPDASKWARLPKFPLYLFSGIYGGFSVTFVWCMVVQGRTSELTHGGNLVAIGWGLFAVLFCLYGLCTIERAKRHVGAR